MCPESLSALFVKPMRSHNPQQETRRLLGGRIALEIQPPELHPRHTEQFALSKIAQPFRFAEIAHTSPLAEGPRQADRPNIACPTTPREGPSQLRKSPPPTNEPKAVPDNLAGKPSRTSPMTLRENPLPRFQARAVPQEAPPPQTHAAPRKPSAPSSLARENLARPQRPRCFRLRFCCLRAKRRAASSRRALRAAALRSCLRAS